MTQYLLDTNIVLCLSNPSDDQHSLVTRAITALLVQSDECYLTAQVLIEFWVVATRPVDVNGLGWSTEQTRYVIDQLPMPQFFYANERLAKSGKASRTAGCTSLPPDTLSPPLRPLSVSKAAMP